MPVLARIKETFAKERPLAGIRIAVGKGSAYEYSNHVPFAAMWLRGIAGRGRGFDTDLLRPIIERAGRLLAAFIGTGSSFLAFAVLVVPTVLMGATLPVLSRFAVRRAGAGPVPTVRLSSRRLPPLCPLFARRAASYLKLGEC